MRVAMRFLVLLASIVLVRVVPVGGIGTPQSEATIAGAPWTLRSDLQTVCRSAFSRPQKRTGTDAANDCLARAWIWPAVRDDFRNWVMAKTA